MSSITYVANSTFNADGKNYQYSATLRFTQYELDKNGHAIPPGSGGSHSTMNSRLAVRSYYKVTGLTNSTNVSALTIEDIAVLFSARRANSIEQEIGPLATTIENRNKRLQDLGTLLSSISKTQSEQEADDKTSNNKNCTGCCYYLNLYFTQDELEKANLKSWVNSNKSSSTNACASSKKDGYIASANQLVKAKIDALNNEAQEDMSRMENLVSKRDEAYNLSTDLSSKISEGRSSILNNIK